MTESNLQRGWRDGGGSGGWEGRCIYECDPPSLPIFTVELEHTEPVLL